MKKVRQILSNRPKPEIYSVSPDQSVLSAAQYMRNKDIGAVAVVGDSALLGILSERDMLNDVVYRGLDPRQVFVEDIMSRHLTTVSPEETLKDCLQKIRKAHCRHLPVVENGRYLGMISVREVIGVQEGELLDLYLWDKTSRELTKLM